MTLVPGKMHRIEVVDTPEVRGAIRKLAHVVEAVEG
jgi:ribosomal protein L30/L7E